MNFLFWMDPLETVKFHKDTTFIIMKTAMQMGHRVFYLPSGGISKTLNDFTFHVVEVRPTDLEHKPFDIIGPHTLLLGEVDLVFIRKDPPFDESYLYHTWLLEQVDKYVPVVNSPRGVRDVNEKIWVSQFTGVTPKTWVTGDTALFESLLASHEKLVIKPYDAFGGQSVFICSAQDLNSRVAFETLSHKGRKGVIVQEFLPEASQGDKRIIVLNGDPLGAVIRVHSEKDHRNNFFAGGTAKMAEITPHEKKVIDMLRPSLLEKGLYFTGLDFIGGRLIEVNVTSPTCLQEINYFATSNLTIKVVDWMETHIKLRRNKNS